MPCTVVAQKAFSRKQGSLTLEKHSVLVMVACLLWFHVSATSAVICLCQRCGSDPTPKVSRVIKGPLAWPKIYS